MTARLQLLQRLRHEASGQTLVLCAVFMGLVAIGFVGLAMDVGYLQQQRRRAQSAADAAALAAAYELTSGYTANEQLVANAVAKQNGFDPGAATNPATVTLSAPATGNFTGSAYVQATVSKPVPLLFMQAFAHQATTVVAASAVAGGSSTSSTCVCLTGTTGNTLSLSNAGSLNASGCGIVNNSNGSNAVTVVGSAVLNALTLGTVSTTWDNSSNINNGGSITSSTKIITGITNTCSPAMPAAPSYSGCVSDPGGSYGTFTFGPANASSVICYNNLTIGANGSTVTLNPGTYVINGGQLHFESGANNKSNQGGNGVFFYLANGASMTIDNGANVNLVAGGGTTSSGGTAPTVGSYNGFVFYQPSSDTNAVSLQGGSSTYINGSLYLPGATLTVGNGSGANVTAGIVAKSLVMNGGAALTAAATTNEGSLSNGAAKMVQ